LNEPIIVLNQEDRDTYGKKLSEVESTLKKLKKDRSETLHWAKKKQDEYLQVRENMLSRILQHYTG
jgi:uncharacterized protein YaaW (UPF0174 family)